MTNPIDRKMAAREIMPLEGIRSRRTLYDHIRKHKFPEPDFPARKRGEADKWLESTVRKHRETESRAVKCCPGTTPEADLQAEKPALAVKPAKEAAANQRRRRRIGNAVRSGQAG